VCARVCVCVCCFSACPPVCLAILGLCIFNSHKAIIDHFTGTPAHLDDRATHYCHIQEHSQNYPASPPNYYATITWSTPQQQRIIRK